MILERLRQLYPGLTKNQKRLADFVAGSYQEVAFMTASRLARTLAVNEATVIRFAQRLGYAGYPQMIQEIQEVVREELRMAEDRSDTAATESVSDALERLVEVIQRSSSHLAADRAEEIMRRLRQAQRIVVLGQGLSAPLAELMALFLREVGLPAEPAPTDAQGLARTLDGAGEDWLLLGITTEDSPQVANALRLAARDGAQTIALTHSPVSPSAQAAHVAVVSAGDDALPLPPLVFYAAFVEAVVQALAARDPEGTGSRRARRAETLRYIAHSGRR